MLWAAMSLSHGCSLGQPYLLEVAKMIQVVSHSKSATPKSAQPAWHELFLRMLPAIRRHARISFRHLNPDSRAEAIQNAICNACSAISRLAELDKLDLAYPTVLARFAVAQTKDGRMLGCPLNCQDISSRYCRRKKNVRMDRLDRFDEEENAWQEVVVEDRHVGPAETARVRLDFSDWLNSLKRRDRRIAETLALGNRTGDVAKKFKVSEGRVSQLRRELAESWSQFIGEKPVEAA